METKNQEKSKKTLWNKIRYPVYLFSILSIILLYLIIFPPKQAQIGDINQLTQKINQVNGTMYYRDNCEFCIEQEKYINISLLKNKVNVGYEPDNGTWKPEFQNISWLIGTPTWTKDINGTVKAVHIGFMDTQQLKEFFGI